MVKSFRAVFLSRLSSAVFSWMAKALSWLSLKTELISRFGSARSARSRKRVSQYGSASTRSTRGFWSVTGTKRERRLFWVSASPGSGSTATLYLKTPRWSSLIGNSRLVVPSFRFTCRVVTYLSSRYRFTLAYQFLNPVCDKSTLIAAGCLAKEKFWFNRAVTYKSLVSVSDPTPVVQTGTFSDLRCV